MELPTAEIGRWPELARGTYPPEARVRRHEGSLTTVQAVVPRHQETRSPTLVTCSAPQPSVLSRRHAARRCGVQQQCRRRPHVPRPASVSPHDPRGHDRRDSGVLRPLGCRAPGCGQAVWLREQANGPPSALRKKWWLLSHLSSARCSSLRTAVLITNTILQITNQSNQNRDKIRSNE